MIVASIKSKNSANNESSNQNKVESILNILQSNFSCKVLETDMTEQSLALKQRIEKRKQKNQYKSDLNVRAYDSISSLELNSKLEALLSQAMEAKCRDMTDELELQFEKAEENESEETTSYTKTIGEANYNKLSQTGSPDESICMYPQKDNNQKQFSIPRHKSLFSMMMSSVNEYLDNFTGRFSEQVFESVFSECMQLVEERDQSINLIREKYFSQTYAMEQIARGQPGSIHTQNIENIIKSLEQDKEYEILEQHTIYRQKHLKLIDSSRNMRIEDNESFRKLLKKLQIDLSSTLSELISVPNTNKKD